MVLSPPKKPWERTNNSSSSIPVASTSSNQINLPALPPKPTNLVSSNSNPIVSSHVVNSTGYPSSFSGASPYTSRYGGGYGGYGGFGGFSRMGAPAGYGGYGGYGGGIGYGPMGGYGGMAGIGGMNNLNFDPSAPQPTLSQTLANSTQSTFQLLESLVMAFSGFSHLLESTFMMTHSSFFTFIQLIEQFNLFKFSIGKILSLFDLLKWCKAWITGTHHRSSNSWSTTFKRYHPGNKGDPSTSRRPTTPPRPSRKPIVIFFLTVFGIPYLMNKLVRSIMAKQQSNPTRNSLDPTTQNEQQITLAIDPSKLTFVKAIHPYHPTTPQEQTMTHQNDMLEKELKFEKNEVIAVLLPTTTEERLTMGWWKGRTRDGRIGWFPKNYVQEIVTNQPPDPSSSAATARQSNLPRQNFKSNQLEIHYQNEPKKNQDQSFQNNYLPTDEPTNYQNDDDLESEELFQLKNRQKFGLTSVKY